ncbi:hypothetical protein JCM19298_1090 [Nonlabens ulvanivorans]|nr:hypothetical protein JCM19298_1090 [Nonlabens ulvanivorans]
MMSKLSFKDYVLVALQGLLFIFYIIDIEILPIKLSKTISLLGFLTAIVGVITLAIALLQLNNNLSPFPTPKTGSQLITVGLYKYIRHPIYTGILFLFYGYAFYNESVYKFLLASLLFVLFQVKTSYEEKKLIQKFSLYKNYKLKTGKFLPKILVKKS